MKILIASDLHGSREKSEKLVTCMYLFPYDAGIVKVGF